MDCAMQRNRGMVSFHLAISGIVYLLLAMISGFIIVVNLTDWSKRRRLMPNDEILASLAFANLSNATFVIMDYFFSLLWAEFYHTFYEVQRVILTLDIATSFSSFWFTAWLSVFYCMKIVSFKWPILLKLKLKFPGLVRWLLLGSTFISLGAALLLQWAVTTATHRKNVTDLTNQTASLPSTFNCTSNGGNVDAILVRVSPFYQILVIILSCSIPLIVVVISSVLVLNLLFRHTQKLEQNLSPSHLEAHSNAAKAVLSLLLCFVVFVISETLIRAEIYPNWYNQYFLCLIVQLATLLAQSIILSRSNPKLKQMAGLLLSHLPGHCRKGNRQGAIELQEV